VADTPDAAGPDLETRLRAAALAASSSTFWTPRTTPGQMLRRIADGAEELGIDEWDRYGERGAVDRLERAIADVLGTEAAVLFPSGIMAQQCALRVWCDRTGSPRVAIQDLSHLLHHEADGPRRLHGFDFEMLTTGRQVATAETLAAVGGRLGAVLVELPLRDAGCLLPTWEELTGLSAACRDRGVPLHLDGARVWEASASYGRAPGEVAALADSIYVSLYKGLAGPAGALVGCAADVADELRTWRKRMGGTIFGMTTQAVGGLLGLRDELPRMGEYLDVARRLAAALDERGLRTFPSPPHIATFLVYAEGAEATVNERLLRWVEEHDRALTSPWREAEVPGWVVTELAVGAATLDHDVTDVADEIAEVVGG
jgi:threonine aldolase